MDSKKDSLIFFQEIEDSSLENNYLLSGLQDFETSLSLVADNRWPSVTTLVWSACEKLLKAILRPKSSSDDNHDNAALQNEFKDLDCDLSESLHNMAHDYRKLRNQISHRGFSPEFDRQCLNQFFTTGVPYFEKLLQYCLKDGLEELSGTHCTWFWEVYRKTRIAVTKHNPDSGVPYNALIFFRGASKRVRESQLGGNVIAGKSSHFISAVQNLPFDIEQDYLEKYFRDYAVNQLSGKEAAALFDFDNIHCPVCQSKKGLLSLNWKETAPQTNDSEFISFGKFVCFNKGCDICLQPVSNQETLKVFFEKKLTKKDRTRLHTFENFEPIGVRDAWWNHPDNYEVYFTLSI